jgi:hypothetical protein
MKVEPRKSVAMEALAFVALIWSLGNAILGVGLIVCQGDGANRPSREGLGTFLAFFGESSTAAGIGFLLSAAVGFLMFVGLRHCQPTDRCLACGRPCELPVMVEVHGVCGPCARPANESTCRVANKASLVAKRGQQPIRDCCPLLVFRASFSKMSIVPVVSMLPGQITGLVTFTC